MRLGQLRPSQGATKRSKRIGRGPGSGHGRTSGRGSKGLLSRTGGRKKVPWWFEGGQMPLQRRLPKRGFTSRSPMIYQVVNVGDLSRCTGIRTITPQVLVDYGLIRKATRPVKILSAGTLTEAVEVQAQVFSLAAAEKIRQAGGKVIVQP